MSKITLTAEQFENIKKVLFGNQKQSGVINDSVIHIVGCSLASYRGQSCLQSEVDFTKACEDFLQGAIDHNHIQDENLVMLIAGRQSLINLKTEGPKVVSVEYPNPESPKVNFRVIMLGEEVEKETETVEAQEVSSEATSQVIKIDHEKLENMSCYDAACAIRDAILPSVPASVRAEINDDSLAAIYCAEAYFKFQNDSDTSSKDSNATGKVNSNYRYLTEEESTKPEKFGKDVISKAVSIWASGGSIADCMSACGLTSAEVKELLNSNGYVVY